MFDRSMLIKLMDEKYQDSHSPQEAIIKKNQELLVSVADVVCKRTGMSDVNCLLSLIESLVKTVDFGIPRSRALDITKRINKIHTLLLSDSFDQVMASLIKTYQQDQWSEKSIQHFSADLLMLTELMDNQIKPTSNDNLIDLLAISRALQNQTKFTEMMQQLEAELQKYVKDNKLEFPVNESGQFTLPENKKKAFARAKILSSYLYQWAKENGFNQHQYAKINDMLKRSQFMELIGKKVIFKDDGPGGYHGAWSHLLQWYYIIEFNKKEKFLQRKDPSDFYADLSKMSISATDRTAWDLFVDRTLLLVSGRTDLRCPENMGGVLTQYNQLLPLLAGSVMRSSNKLKMWNMTNVKVATQGVVVSRSYKK